MRQFILILSGPSGVGKTSIGHMLTKCELKTRLGIEKVITHTTRAMRPGEIDGRDYYFVSKTEFALELSCGNFVEWEEIFGNFYGTTKEEIQRILDKGLCPLLVIDTKGAHHIRTLYKAVVSIFIMPPSLEELRHRLENRPNMDEDIDLRLSIAKEEIKEKDHYDYVVVNDVIDRAVEEISQIILRERRKSDD